MHCEVSASHSELSLSLRVGTTASHDVFLLENNFSQVAMITQSWVTLSLNFIICSYLDLCCTVISSEHISLWLYIIQSYNFIAFISSSSYFNFAWSYFSILLFFTIWTMMESFTWWSLTFGLWWSLSDYHEPWILNLVRFFFLISFVHLLRWLYYQIKYFVSLAWFVLRNPHYIT